MGNIDNIRNFCILAHIDHGKSTLADRFLELTGTVEAREMRPQYLDQLDLERERGITIKMAPARMVYRPAKILSAKSEILNKSQSQNDKFQKGLEIRNSDLEAANSEYILNLIDTPGHSDFSYEVSRALEAVEGGILLVDATQGIQAQTLVNYERAKKAGLTIIGAINKIDLFLNRGEEIKTRVHELAELLETDDDKILRVSGKSGTGVPELLQSVIDIIPPPRRSTPPSILENSHHSLNSREFTPSKSALVFDSIYDDHKGIVAFVRVFGDNFRGGEIVKLLAADEQFKIKEVGYFKPKLSPSPIIETGEMGYIATGIKDPDVLRIGDTIGPVSGGELLPGYKPPKPVVFVSLYPEDADDYEGLRQALERLKLNDSSLTFDPEMNEVLGRGFRCGFLGQLHFEITTERLEKEFNLPVISTFPSVAYTIKESEKYRVIHNAENLPPSVQEILEPMVLINIIAPMEQIGSILHLSARFRLKDIETQPFSGKMHIKARMPLTSLIADFDGSLKSVSSGMASFSYELTGEAPADLEKVEILVAGDSVPGLTRLMYRDELEIESRKVLAKLKDLLPRQQFAQALQARAGTRIVAREDIPAMRKDVTGYLYGGDRTRKMKLWKKQKRGKERLKSIGRVTIEPHIFKELLKK